MTKQATTEKSFYEWTPGSAPTAPSRSLLDVRARSDEPDAGRIRAGSLFQDASVAGRDYIIQDHDSSFVAAKWKPRFDTMNTVCELHSHRSMALPHFGVPYYQPGLPRHAIHDHGRRSVPGFRRQSQQFLRLRQSRLLHGIKQDIGTINAEVQITPDLIVSNKIRASRSLLNYIGTLPEAPITSIRFGVDAQRQSAEPLSGHRRRRQPDRGDLQIQHRRLAAYRARAASKYSRETSSIDKYTGLSSEALPARRSAAPDR